MCIVVNECPHCQKTFLGEHTRKFCSRECVAAARRANTTNRFWSNVDKTGDCWLWQLHCDKDGYGQVTIFYKNTRAHKYAWIITNGVVPDNLYVCHTCDNPKCVNPSHLFLGNNTDNMRDAMVKKRLAYGDKNPSRTQPEKFRAGVARYWKEQAGKLTHRNGETNGSAKLTEKDVKQMRLDYLTGNFTYKDFAVKYSISTSQVSKIIRRKVWKHVKDS